MLDESLARGLKNTLWRSAQEETKRIIKIAHNNQSRPAFTTRKGVRRGIDFIERQYATPLRLASGRSDGRKPLWWSIMLTMDEDVPVNEWQENVFGFCFVGERFLPHLAHYWPSRSRVSEHAVSRLYQRAPQEIGLPWIASIYPELTCAGLHGYWHLHALRIAHGSGMRFTAFLPTQKGAFLGEIGGCGDWLDLRTYIAKEQMREEQRRLWNELRALGIDDEALQLFPEYMFNRGPISSVRAAKITQSLLTVLTGFPRLLGSRLQDEK